jgi:hypothetical protein
VENGVPVWSGLSVQLEAAKQNLVKVRSYYCI